MWHQVRSHLGLGIIIAAGLMGGYAVPFTIGGLVDGLGLDVSRAGNLGAAELFSVALSALFLSSFLHRLSLTKVAAIALLTSALCQFLSATTENYLLLFLFRALVGAGCGALIAVVNSIVATSKTPETSYGWIFTISASLFTLLLICLPQALKFNDQQGLFIALGCVTLLVFTQIPKIPHTNNDEMDNRSCNSLSSSSFSSSSSISIPTLAAFFFILTVVYIFMGGAWSFSERIAASIDIDLETVGLLLGLSTAAGIAGSFTAALIGNRLGLLLPIAIGFICSGLSVLLIVLAQDIWSFSAGVLLFGYIYTFCFTYVLSLAAALDRMGRIAIATNGYILIPYSMGPVLFGMAGLNQFYLLGWLALGVGIIAVILIWPIATRVSEF